MPGYGNLRSCASFGTVAKVLRLLCILAMSAFIIIMNEEEGAFSGKATNIFS